MQPAACTASGKLALGSAAFNATTIEYYYAANARVWTVQNTNFGLNVAGTDYADVMIGSISHGNTLNGGRGADLLFQKTGNDLILKIGATDQITFTGYLASASNHSVDKLQLVIEGT